jgi:metal-responsive CopG/Arc/MetJ family transcriptional regulator
MANQRARNKKVISVPLTEEVLRAIEREAKRRGTDRVKIINEVLKAALKIPLWALVALLASWSAKSPGS